MKYFLICAILFSGLFGTLRAEGFFWDPGAVYPKEMNKEQTKKVPYIDLDHSFIYPKKYIFVGLGIYLYKGEEYTRSNLTPESLYYTTDNKEFKAYLKDNFVDRIQPFFPEDYGLAKQCGGNERMQNYTSVFYLTYGQIKNFQFAIHEKLPNAKVKIYNKEAMEREHIGCLKCVAHKNWDLGITITVKTPTEQSAVTEIAQSILSGS